MSDLLRAELLKLRTTRTFAALVAAAVLLALAFAILGASLVDLADEDDVNSIMLSDTSSLFILVLAVIGMTGEWRHRTITGTILAAPDRTRVVLAKIAAYATAGVVLSLLVNLAVMVTATIILSARDELTLGIGELADILWRNLVLAAFLGAFGVVIGALVRHQAGAIIGLLVVLFLVEPAVLGFAPDVGRFGPLLGAPGGFLADDTFAGDDDLLPAGAAFAVMVAWLAAGAAAAVALMRSRDVT